MPQPVIHVIDSPRARTSSTVTFTVVVEAFLLAGVQHVGEDRAGRS